MQGFANFESVWHFFRFFSFYSRLQRSLKLVSSDFDWVNLPPTGQKASILVIKPRLADSFDGSPLGDSVTVSTRRKGGKVRQLLNLQITLFALILPTDLLN